MAKKIITIIRTVKDNKRITVLFPHVLFITRQCDRRVDGQVIVFP